MADEKLGRGQATRRHILDTATRLFAHDGYAAVSIETVLRETGLSRGALYHHFAGKEALFAAVLEEAEMRVAAVVGAAAAKAPNPTEALRAGCDAWLDLAADDAAVRRIVLLDAPAVVGWETWREIDGRHALGLLAAGLTAAGGGARVKAADLQTRAHLLLAVLIEAAMLTARCGDEEANAHRRAAVQTVLSALLPLAPSADHA